MKSEVRLGEFESRSVQTRDVVKSINLYIVPTQKKTKTIRLIFNDIIHFQGLGSNTLFAKRNLSMKDNTKPFLRYGRNVDLWDAEGAN
jgi:hypothetical protein